MVQKRIQVTERRHKKLEKEAHDRQMDIKDVAEEQFLETETLRKSIKR